MPFFKLQEGEKVVKNIKPLPALRNFFIFGTIIAFIIFGIIILALFFAVPHLFLVWVILAFFAFLLLITFWFFANMRYKKQHYWVTNKRIIYKRGLIGYRITSIPLERISDIILSRSFIEKLFGFGSLHVQTLAGQITYQGRLGAEASLLAVPNPEETQELIFGLIKRKRKREKITF